MKIGAQEQAAIKGMSFIGGTMITGLAQAAFRKVNDRNLSTELPPLPNRINVLQNQYVTIFC